MYHYQRVDQNVTIRDASHNDAMWHMTFEAHINEEVYRCTVTARHYLTPTWVSKSLGGPKLDRYQVVARGLDELARMIRVYHPEPVEKGWQGTWRE